MLTSPGSDYGLGALAHALKLGPGKFAAAAATRAFMARVQLKL